MIENSHLKQLLDDLSSLVQTACIIQNGISIKRLSFMKLGTASWFSNITNLQVDEFATSVIMFSPCLQVTFYRCKFPLIKKESFGNSEAICKASLAAYLSVWTGSKKVHRCANR